MKTNDIILQTVTKFTLFVIILFSIHLFFAGHYHPGGGFIGGLMTSGAIVLLLLAGASSTFGQAGLDLSTVRPIIPGKVVPFLYSARDIYPTSVYCSSWKGRSGAMTHRVRVLFPVATSVTR